MNKPVIKKEWIGPLILLHAIMLVYSVSAVFSKLASEQSPLSIKFIVYYGAVLFIMFIYAILWQQVLKKMPLTTAYANKAVVIIWGIVWGKLFYGEQITVRKIVASIIIIIGVGLVVTSEDE